MQGAPTCPVVRRSVHPHEVSASPRVGMQSISHGSKKKRRTSRETLQKGAVSRTPPLRMEGGWNLLHMPRMEICIRKNTNIGSPTSLPRNSLQAPCDDLLCSYWIPLRSVSVPRKNELSTVARFQERMALETQHMDSQ